jgi:hypothetical protein
MVWRSQMRPEISFLGPIDSWKEFVFYVLRQGYAGTDNNAAAGVADKLLYLSYLVREAGGQLLLPGAALAVVGFIVQWQRWGRITAWALTLSFLGPTLLLTLLLNFDYDPFRREAFRFYPAAAWGLLALWAGLGLQVVVDRFPMCWQQRAVVSAAALMVLAAGGAHWARNDRSGDWLGREYAATVLAELEPDAVLLVQGDLDLPTTGYLHLIEGRRPDVQLVSEQSLVLEPRLFDPFQTPKDAAANIVDAYARDCGRPVYRTLSSDMRPGTVSWLLFKLDPASEAGAGKQHYRFPPGERALLKRIVAHGPFSDGWSEFLRRFLYEAFIRFQTRAELAGEWPGKNDPELARMIDSVLDLPEAALMRAAVLSDADALGKADEIHVLLERFAAQVGDPWVKKHHLARYYNVVARGAQLSGHHRVARVALTRSLAYWPEAANPATKAEASYRRHEQQKGE